MKLYVINSQADNLSPKKTELLEFLSANTGRAMKAIELMQAMGWRSPAPLLFCLKILEEKGNIRLAT
jgi:hypothetical protein